MPGASDPVAFFAHADGSAPRTLWMDGKTGFALAGSGEAFSARSAGADRFASVSAALKAVERTAVAAAESGLAPVGLVALGGFAFDPQRPSEVEWSGFPDALMSIPRLLLRRDGGAEDATLTVTVPVTPDDDPVEVAEAIQAEVERARNLPLDAAIVEIAPTPVLRRESPQAETWKGAVAAAAGDVRAGRFDKVVLARTERIACAAEIDVAATLRRMANGNPTGMVFAIGLPGAVFLGASPETLVSLRGGVLKTTPLAGSIARGETEEEDERLARRLLRSQKDRIEHEVVVGAILQGLDGIGIDVHAAPDAPVVVRNRTVQHLATPITGVVRPGVTAVDIVGRLHPTPAVGGYPREAALAAIREREGFDRGWYAGPVGWCGPDGDGHFCIGIRSALVRGTDATLYAGCGIVADSDPETEYAETRLKLQAIGAALGLA